nr:MAG TPA: hypothetical protein [Crassvirales sp.]
MAADYQLYKPLSILPRIPKLGSIFYFSIWYLNIFFWFSPAFTPIS